MPDETGNGAGRLAVRRRKTRGRSVSLIVLLVTATFHAAPVSASEPTGAFAVRGDLPRTSIGEAVSILEDPSGALSIGDVTRPDVAARFVRSTTPSPSFGYSRSTYWFRLELENSDAQPAFLLLDVGFPQLDHVELFEPTGEGRFRSIHLGDSQPYRNRPLPLSTFVFPVTVAGKVSSTYYLRIASTSIVSVPLHLTSALHSAEYLQESALLIGLLYGVLLGLLAYNLFLFASTREAAYFYYVAAGAGFALYFAQLDGLLAPVWPEQGPWHDLGVWLFAWILGMSVIQFARAFLETATGAPRLDRALRAALWLLILSPVLVPFVEYSTLGVVVAAMTALSALQPAAGVIRLRAGFRPAGPYLIAWTPTLLALFLVSTAPLTIDFLEAVLFVKLAVVSERVLMSLALGSRLKMLRQREVALSQEALRERARALAESERRLEVESLLGSREAQLLQAQKMEAVGRLAGGVAHDFNNLLTVIQGYTEMLLRTLPARDPARGTADGILKATRQGVVLTRQLLAFSRRSNSTATLVDVNELVSGMAQMLTRLLGKAIDIELSLDPKAGCIEADPAQIEQIIVNLVVNARDALDGPGEIAIRTGLVDIGGVDTSFDDLEAPGQYVRIAVSDTGTGMSPETRARVFEPFFTTKEIGKGTGLGLSTAYGIVKQAGGTIRVDSTPGEGSTFEILLPHRDAPAADREPAEPATETPTGTETILLVEDEPRVRELTQSRLEALGYTVLAAADAEAALRIANANAETIGLLLTDVILPGQTGPELSRRLAATHPGIPVVFTSGYPQRPGDPESAVPDGAAYLQKPASIDALARIVRETLDGV